MEIFGSNKDAWKIGIDQAFLFPTASPILNWDYFQTKEYEFFGGQKVNEVFVPAYNGVGAYDWSPFNDYAFSQLTTMIGQAVEKKSSWTAALDTLQSNVTTYATQQGFKVPVDRRGAPARSTIRPCSDTGRRSPDHGSTVPADGHAPIGAPTDGSVAGRRRLAGLLFVAPFTILLVALPAAAAGVRPQAEPVPLDAWSSGERFAVFGNYPRRSTTRCSARAWYGC